MKCFGDVDAAEVFRLFDVTSEVINVGELVGILEGELIKRPEVSTRPLATIRLVLKVEWTAVIVSILGVNSFYYTKADHFLPSLFARYCFGRTREQGASFAPDWGSLSVNCVFYRVFDIFEVRCEY